MITFKEFVSDSKKVSARHTNEVKAKTNSRNDEIRHKMDDKRAMLQQHLIHKSVNKQMRYTEETGSDPDYHTIDVDVQHLHNHVSKKTPTASNIKTMHNMVHSFAKKHEMPVNVVYTLVKNNQQAYPAYQKEA